MTSSVAYSTSTLADATRTASPLRRQRTTWRLLRCWRWLAQVNALEPGLKAQSSDALRTSSLALGYRAQSGEPAARLLPEAFGLAREAARRTIGMRHFDVQIVGGAALARGCLVEMATGEGKTLVATLPLYLHALAGRGAHLATVNDYLARRDADWMRSVYSLLGMSVGVVESSTPPHARQAAYRCDITYGTGKELGFDFLRDRLKQRAAVEEPDELIGRLLGQSLRRPRELLQREPHFALVDEADSILIDEAGTPLIISVLPPEAQTRRAAAYRWAAECGPRFIDGEHYELDAAKRQVHLLPQGRWLARTLALPEEARPLSVGGRYEFLERAIQVGRLFQRDRHYVVHEEEVAIVDEFTGRIAEGRKWRDGIHQAIEAREQLEITPDGGQAAQVTVQDFFRRYSHLAGMSGTLVSSARELKRIYRTPVVAIPTNRPPRRRRLTERIFGTAAAKWAAIVEEVRQMHATGRPVLVGTRSIDKSELLSGLLREAGIEHQVLHARHVPREAEIVAGAGQLGRVTVATNMAGRGTDIRLGPGVQQLGGLHVIASELHDSPRIDRQLIGRCGRQGDPGSFRQFLAMDDDILLAGLGPKRAARLKTLGTRGQPVSRAWRHVLRQAQRRVGRQAYRTRRALLWHQRQVRKQHREMGLDPYLDLADH